MKRYTLSIITILILIVSITSITYAWFTYVERKSLAIFEAGEIQITTYMNDTMTINNFNLVDLAYLDFDKDVELNQSMTFDYMVSSLSISIRNNPRSPLTKNMIRILAEGNPEGLIYFIVLDGVNIDSSSVDKAYHQMILSIINGHQSKTEALEMIETYNQTILDAIYQTIIKENDVLSFRIIFWGDYDLASNQSGYLDQSYSLTLIIDTISAKGEVTIE